MSRSGWWREECPARGPALTHAHWSDCPDEHPPRMCCHCEKFQPDPSDEEIAMEGPTARVEETKLADHEYVWTIAGRCGRCHLHPMVHPTYRKGVLEGECPVEHGSITSKQLIGDDGLQWSQCPQCSMQVEPKHITGNGPQGTKTARGRGDLTKRQMEALVTVCNREAFYDWLSGRG